MQSFAHCIQQQHPISKLQRIQYATVGEAVPEIRGCPRTADYPIGSYILQSRTYQRCPHVS